MITIFTLAMMYLFLIAKESVDKGRIPICEWAAVICAELFVGTFYFDLGKDFYIEQVEIINRKERSCDDMA